MKITAILAAGLVAVTGLAPVALATPASAQERIVVRERTVVRHDSSRRYGYRHRAHRRTVCRIQHRRHRDVRVCRTVYR